MVVMTNTKRKNLCNERAIASGKVPAPHEDNFQTLMMFIRSNALRQLTKLQKKRLSGYDVTFTDLEIQKMKAQIYETAKSIMYSKSKAKKLLGDQAEYNTYLATVTDDHYKSDLLKKLSMRPVIMKQTVDLEILESASATTTGAIVETDTVTDKIQGENDCDLPDFLREEDEMVNLTPAPPTIKHDEQIDDSEMRPLPISRPLKRTIDKIHDAPAPATGRKKSSQPRKMVDLEAPDGSSSQAVSSSNDSSISDNGSVDLFGNAFASQSSCISYTVNEDGSLVTQSCNHSSSSGGVERLKITDKSMKMVKKRLGSTHGNRRLEKIGKFFAVKNLWELKRREQLSLTTIQCFIEILNGQLLKAKSKNVCLDVGFFESLKNSPLPEEFDPRSFDEIFILIPLSAFYLYHMTLLRISIKNRIIQILDSDIDKLNEDDCYRNQSVNV
ncbi:Oidioi.mRNA.OKI2018_I69.YSR.g17107.t1.cds [Oikopleura dioica]|uniref:Oidioi.mRNA.OKI2018_I69.YSR.g17107.t1.cds n=1 Tax=Oikopleura dioica TaxID=34765 RepID=A0ABN7SNB1_OIKDI|nr:Oidioi.mRNA.OKI2018_I69.YSR.g17107.t1.cds [Oikopleura dioica]